MTTPKPPRPSIQPFIADEMSTSRGKRFAMQQALGTPQRKAPTEAASPMLQALDALTAAGARAQLSKFLVERSADLEAAVKKSDVHAARALLRAWEQVSLDAQHSEQVLAWVGRLGRDRALLSGLATGNEPGKAEAVAIQALHDRVMTTIVSHAARLVTVSLEARFGGQRTAYAKMTGALTRIFRDFDSKSAFAEVAKMKPVVQRPPLAAPASRPPRK